MTGTPEKNHADAKHEVLCPFRYIPSQVKNQLANRVEPCLINTPCLPSCALYTEGKCALLLTAQHLKSLKDKLGGLGGLFK